MNKRYLKIMLVCLLATITFYLGMLAQQFLYDDMCLDLGGGKNPGDYPICVLPLNGTK